MEKFKKILKVVKSYFIISLGLLAYTAGWVIFILPNGLVGGGVSGISAIIQYTTGFPVSYSFLIINTILLAIALKVLGKGFGFKTVFAIVLASLYFKVLPLIIPDTFIQEIAISNGKLLCTLIGGLASGIGIGITFNQGGSTGGTDIVALMINKYKNIPPGKLLLLIDIFIIASSMLVPSDLGIGIRLANVMYGYIIVAVCGYSIDLFISGTKQSVQIFIFSKEYDAIADKVSSEMNRGVTVLDGEGWFTKKNGKILMIIVRKTESNMVFKIVKEIDKNAFLSVGSVTGVYGQGFDVMKK